MAEKLKPCPNVICDYSRRRLNETDADLNATHTWVSCENCGACGPRIENPSQYYGRTAEWDDVKARAVAGWNNRPANTRISVLEEAAKVADNTARRAAAVADERNKRGDPIDTAIASEIVAENIATAIRSLSQPVEGSAGASEASHD